MLPAGGSATPTTWAKVATEGIPPVTWLMKPITRAATRLVPTMVTTKTAMTSTAGAELASR